MGEVDRVGDTLASWLPGLRAVYVFGSTARGEARPTSDLDLAILLPRPLDPRERFELQERLAAALGRDVDLVDLRRASTVLQMQVVSTGRVVYDGDLLERRRFEAFVYSSYARLNEERREVLAAIEASGSVHGR